MKQLLPLRQSAQVLTATSSIFPAWMDWDDVDSGYDKLIPEILGIQEPPIANIYPISAGSSLEDYRNFIIEFNERATETDVISAVHLAITAIVKHRHNAPDNSA